MKNCVSGVLIPYLGNNMRRDGLRANVNHVRDRPSAVESTATSTERLPLMKPRSENSVVSNRNSASTLTIASSIWQRIRIASAKHFYAAPEIRIGLPDSSRSRSAAAGQKHSSAVV